MLELDNCAQGRNLAPEAAGGDGRDQTITENKKSGDVIGPRELQEAIAILNRYKEGKAALSERVVANEQWYRMRHWDTMKKTDCSGVEPASGWLFNVLANKHADAMDNYPTPCVLPREAGDAELARQLSRILPVVLESCDFESVYSDVQDSKNRSGVGIYSVTWDAEMLGGLGDIRIAEVDVLNLFWESGITDLQKSRNVFYVSLEDVQTVEARYPAAKGRLSPDDLLQSKYVYEDNVDLTGKVSVVDWYYRRRQAGRDVLHYCKFAGDQVLFATENDPLYAQRGWYDHGLYPFVVDTLFKTKGSLAGFGYIDVGKNAQEYIDRGNQGFLENLLANSRPRYFIRTDGAVNEEEFADQSRDFVHVDGQLGQDSVLPINGKTLNPTYLSLINSKIDELKETTGNRDVSTGGSTGGVTAAAGIAAMQEAGSKLNRDASKGSYRAFRKVVFLCIELIRQFYELPRCFRILGEGGGPAFVQFCNAGLRPQPQGDLAGLELGLRMPLFDIQVVASKSSPYSRLSQNELALQFYNAGFFRPELADQALMCLEMMDFDGKEQLMQRIARNGSLFQQLRQVIENQRALLTGEGPEAGAVSAPSPQGGSGVVQGVGECAVTRRARQRAAGTPSAR